MKILGLVGSYRKRARNFTIFLRNHGNCFLFSIALLGFFLCFYHLSSIYLSTIPTDDEIWIWRNLFPNYWLGIFLILISQFYFLYSSRKKNTIWISVFLSGLLMVSTRMIFTVTMGKPFILDTYWYIEETQNWLDKGFYQWIIPAGRDYPMAIFFSYFFLKLGVPQSLFFLWAPSAIYMINTFLVYFIAQKISGNDKVGALSAFFYAGMSCGYTSWHHCPNNIGMLFCLLSLYLLINFTLEGWDNRKILITCTSIFFLIMSHHLSILFFILTVTGLVISHKLFKTFDDKSVLMLAFSSWYAISLWTLWQSTTNPFRVYDWFHAFINSFWGIKTPEFTSSVSFSSFTELVFLDQISFLAYPTFIVLLGICGLFYARARDSDFKNIFFISLGWNLLLAIFLFFSLLTFGYLQPIRLYDFMLIGAYPFSAKSYLMLGKSNKKYVLLCIVTIAVFLLATHNIYRLLQRYQMWLDSR